jgi:hypothetical protein
MNRAELHAWFEESAREIERLKSRIDSTYGRATRDEWREACKEFHARYDGLAFPGGYEAALRRLVEGDQTAIDAALTFLEVRPYFFRSGFMFSELLRKVKRAPLSPDQISRLQSIVTRQREWTERKVAGAHRSIGA